MTKVMTNSDDKNKKTNSDDIKWLHKEDKRKHKLMTKMITQRDDTTWWHKVMTQIQDTKYFEN